MNQHQFQNRAEAADQLADLLSKYRGCNGVVLGIPRGGVVTAQIIAKKLNLPLGLTVVRKIGHPDNPEFAIAAVSESGLVVEDKSETSRIDRHWLKTAAQRQLEEAQRRRARFWGRRQVLDLAAKTVILVDDGLATGLTMESAIKEVKQQSPAKIVVAVPMSPTDTAEKIKSMVDELVVIIVPDIFSGAVGSYYQNFPQVEDEEVARLINWNIKYPLFSKR